ncbi:MAG: hypothetical protein V8R22_03725 [Lachnospiraceae bacterium]
MTQLILADAIVELRKWITETHIAFRLLTEKFTLRELQQIHETVLDTSKWLHLDIRGDDWGCRA